MLPEAVERTEKWEVKVKIGSGGQKSSGVHGQKGSGDDVPPEAAGAFFYKQTLIVVRP